MRDAHTVCELFQATATRYAEREAFRTRAGEVTLTWRDYGEQVRRLAAGLAALGVEPGETLALMLRNRPEFHVADTAAFHLGAVPFSLYNSSSAEQIEFLLRDAEPSVVITEQAFVDVIERIRSACPSVEHVFVVDGDPSLADLEQHGAADFDFDARWRAVQPSDLLTLIYTSGTTGPPKGVQITHANYLAELRAFDGIGDFEAGRVVSYFPMAHIAERAVSHYNAIAYGHTVTCCPDAREVAAYLPEVRPTFFFAVPRIWEKLKAGIEAGIAADPDEARRVRTLAAVEAGDAEAFAELRERLGLDQVKHVLVGAAPSVVEVLAFFHAIGIELLEVWGLCETTGIATANTPGRAKLGTVGRAATGVELRLAEDGEVLVRSGIVTPGYRNRPDLTAEAIDADGWLRTGDVGRIDDDGYLSIVDRKKELIINSAGQNMSPSNIEAQLKAASGLIGQACVIGDRRRYNVALIVLDPDAAAGLGSDATHDAVAAAVERANERLSRPEQIKRFHLLDTEWAPAGEELTPTLKLRRRAIEAKYAAEIEAMYTDG